MALTGSAGGRRMTLKLQSILELQEGEGRAPSFIRLAAGWISLSAGWMLSAACLPEPGMKAAAWELWALARRGERSEILL